LNLQYDEPLSKFVFNWNLRRYISGKVPWEAKSEAELKTMVVHGPLKFPSEIATTAGGTTVFSPKLKSFIQGLLEKNPNKRLGMLKEGIKVRRCRLTLSNPS
jgi:hypothetical protein